LPKLIFGKELGIYTEIAKPQGGLTRREFVNFHVKANERQPTQFTPKLIAAYCYILAILASIIIYDIQ
jgi:hypothetical protein